MGSEYQCEGPVKANCPLIRIETANHFDHSLSKIKSNFTVYDGSGVAKVSGGIEFI